MSATHGGERGGAGRSPLEWREFDDPANGTCTPDARTVHAAATPNGFWTAYPRGSHRSGKADDMADAQVAAIAALREMIAETAAELGGVVTWTDVTR